MPSRERVEAFLKAVVEGSHVKAIADFYHDDATMQENLGVPRRGKETLTAREQSALDQLQKMHTHPVQTFLVDGDNVAIRWTFDKTDKDGSRPAAGRSGAAAAGAVIGSSRSSSSTIRRLPGAWSGPDGKRWKADGVSSATGRLCAPDGYAILDESRLARTDRSRSSAMARLRDVLRRLYHGRTPAAFRFQMAVIVIDLAIIAFFIASPVLSETRSFLWIDYSVAALVAADMIARLLASTDMLRLLKQPASWVDIFILADTAFPAGARQSRFPAHPEALVASAEPRALAAA